MFWKLIYSIEKNLNLKRSFDIKKDIKKEELETYIKQGGILIDVRHPLEYAKSHDPRSINIYSDKIIMNYNEKIK